MWLRVWAITVLAVVALVAPAEGAKKHLFKTCDQNGFCNRNRHYADAISQLGGVDKTPYELDLSTVTHKGGKIEGVVVKTIGAGKNKVELPLSLSFLTSGGVRLSIDEKQRLDGAIEVLGHESVTHQRYNVSHYAFRGPVSLVDDVTVSKDEDNRQVVVKYSGNKKVVIEASPLQVSFYKDASSSSPDVVLNGKGFLNFEHWRPIDADNSMHMNEFESSTGAWEEEFDGYKDKKSRGPEAVALDVTFPGYSHVYGIPEHADSLSLKETRGAKEGDHSDPYRLYNVDIFEYETDSPMAMYGSIPFMQAQKPGGSAGVFWANAADTYVDITKDKKDTTSHWMSEGGLLDIFVFLGDSPQEMNQQYGDLTGYTFLPQSFAIGYHQCRWNYNSEEDVLEVNDNFDKHAIPYDTIWLDIEYLSEKKYFTWNEALFSNPQHMMAQLDKTGRKLVPIIDPHIKVTDDYDVVKALRDRELATRDSKGEIFHGHCWPGESIWIDSFNPDAQLYWDFLFSADYHFGGAASNLHIWNDMNEPSVFSGPETSMPRDNIHHGGWEHRDIHNIHGMVFHNATMVSLNKRYHNLQRPFTLTRSYFSGSQRLGAMWTGDNMAKWEYLKVSIPMVLTQGVAGMPFGGADVGGFFGDPSPELHTRWLQAGAFYPFFRGHAHIDSKRREPYIGTPETVQMNRDAVRLRYRLLPTMYNAFHQSSVDGSPVLQPLYYYVPTNEKVFAIDDQFFIGDSGVMAKPVTDEGATSVEMYLPDSKPYYNFYDYKVVRGEGKHKVDAPLDKVPILLRGGHIHPRRERYRRSSELQKHDPYTLVIAADDDGTAKGSLYADDGQSYDYLAGNYVQSKIEFDGRTIEAKSVGPKQGSTLDNDYAKPVVERIVVAGVKTKATEATVTQDGNSWSVKVLPGPGQAITIRNPRVVISKDWSIKL
uniref:Glucosidase II subunit alpha n=1 Tax=Blastobotrys adeninivorans TaxID=409370 RepID=A0A060TA68_BLAAD